MDRVDRYAKCGFDCVCGNLRMAARAVTAVYDRHLSPAGLQASQMAVLWAVAGMKSASIKEIAKRIVMDETTLVRNLRVLERRGWVSIEVGEDRRKRIVTLTAQGREVFSQALPLWQRAQKEMTALLAEPGLQEMNEKLLHLTTVVR